MTDRQQEYIRLLEERNRLKRMITGKTAEEQQKEELERGFSTHFRGAHASKEAATTKSASKPVVKVHKAPNLDLISRLLPQGSNDAATSGGNSSRSTSRSRQGGRRPSFQQDDGNQAPLSHRSQWSQEEYDMNQLRADMEKEDDGQVDAYEEDQNEYYTEKVEPVAPNNSSSSATTTQPAGDITNVLVGHIANLTPEQQMAILQLLQQATPANAIAPIANIIPSVQPLAQNAEQSKSKAVLDNIAHSEKGSDKSIHTQEMQEEKAVKNKDRETFTNTISGKLIILSLPR